jgi:hypothetical protein
MRVGMHSCKLFLIFIVLFVFTAESNKCVAQFWKKKRSENSTPADNADTGKGEPIVQPWHTDLTKKPRKPTRVPEPAQVRRDTVVHKKQKPQTAPAEYTNPYTAERRHNTSGHTVTAFKERYRIDVLANLYLDEIQTNKRGKGKTEVPEKAAAGLAFYQGILLAADSLKKTDCNIDIFVHDVSSPNESVDTLVLQHRLDSADLIIGAVAANQLAVPAKFAKSRHINFISALSPADGGIYNNKFFTILQPTLKTHARKIAKYISAEEKGKNIILLYRKNSLADSNAYSYISADTGSKRWHKIECTELPTKKDWAVWLDTAKENVLVLGIVDISYADSLLKNIAQAAPEKKLTVYGMPSWSGLNLQKRIGQYGDLKISYTSPFVYSDTNTLYKTLETSFTTEYGKAPNDLVFRSFETVFWYGNLLHQYGTIFNMNYNDTKKAPFTKFNMKLRQDKSGKVFYFENTHVELLHFENKNQN